MNLNLEVHPLHHVYFVVWFVVIRHLINFYLMSVIFIYSYSNFNEFLYIVHVIPHLFFIVRKARLLVDPWLSNAGVLGGTFGEPESDLLLGVLDRVGTMADVSANSESKVATDGADGGGKGVGGAKHGTASLDSIKTLPNHGDDGAGGHILDQAREERLAFEISIMLLEVGLCSLD